MKIDMTVLLRKCIGALVLAGGLHSLDKSKPGVKKDKK